MYTEHVPQLVIISIEINNNNDGVYICIYLCINMYIYISRKYPAARQRINWQSKTSIRIVCVYIYSCINEYI